MVTPPVDSLAPDRPGEYLRQLLAQHNITPYRCAKDCGIAPHLIGKLRDGRLAFTTRTAAILGRYFGVDPMTFLMLQAIHDLATTTRDLQARLNEIRPLADTPAQHSPHGAPHE